MASWVWWVTLQGGERNEDTQGMWNIYLIELTNPWTKMQELSSIFIKPNLVFCSAWLLVRLSPSGTKEGCMSVRVFTLLLGCILFIPYYKVSGQQIFEKCLKIFFLWKYFIIFLIYCSHPWLIKIIFQSSNCMDPMLLAIILFHSFFKKDISLFFIKRFLFLFIVVHQICVLNKAGIKLAQT